MIIKTSGVTDDICDIVPTLFEQGRDYLNSTTSQPPINKLKNDFNYAILFIT